MLDTILAYKCTLEGNPYYQWVMATRQNSINGKPKSPRIQVVLPEELCERLAKLADNESRTVSNMAKVLIQKGIEKFENQSFNENNSNSKTDAFRSALESQQSRTLKGAPRKIRFLRP